MKLNEVFKILHISGSAEREIQGITDDSRLVQKDWLYLVRKGHTTQGSLFIKDALRKGAVVLAEEAYDLNDVYQVQQLEIQLPLLLHAFYQDPWRRLCMIAVTGTNGKSSVTDLLKQLLERNAHQIMTIGTGHIRFQEADIEIHNTTPSVFTLLHYLAQAVDKGIDTVIMEVSSHAVDQHRIRGIFFDYIIYTNITQDHLDYHLTRTHYQYTKFKLQDALKEQGVLILNDDDPVLRSLYHLANHKIITCGQQAHYTISDVSLHQRGSSFRLHTYGFHTNLLGMVNIYNLVEAIIVCRCLSIPYEKLQDDTALLTPVEGRLQCLSGTPFSIWIDYAHTYIAVKAILDFANQVKKGRVILIVGCGGEREKEKRRLIGTYAQEHADIAIFTADNPRNEQVQDILMDMLPENPSRIRIFENRYYAIKHAVKIAGNSDIIVIAGKGNEKTQQIHGREYAFHDESCVYEILSREELI